MNIFKKLFKKNESEDVIVEDVPVTDIPEGEIELKGKNGNPCTVKEWFIENQGIYEMPLKIIDLDTLVLPTNEEKEIFFNRMKIAMRASLNWANRVLFYIYDTLYPNVNFTSVIITKGGYTYIKSPKYLSYYSSCDDDDEYLDKNIFLALEKEWDSRVNLAKEIILHGNKTKI